MKGPRRWPLLLVLAALPASSSASPVPDEEKPFPVERTAILREEKTVYYVEGRVRIPRGVEITCLKDVHIKARGSGPAVIEVEGSLKVHGVKDREVIFENVVVEPQEEFKEIRMDMTVFRDGGGVRTPKEKAVSGDLMLELFDFTKGASMEVLFSSGSIEMSTVCSDAPVSIRTVDPEGSTRSKVRIFIRGCIQNPRYPCAPHGGRVGLVGGLVVDGGGDVTVQLSRTGGDLTAVRNWDGRLIFDGLKVNSRRLEFSHRDAGNFNTVQCAKLDIYSDEVSASAPLDPKVRELFKMDRCWFRGEEDTKRIHEKYIKDAQDDPEKNGVNVFFPKVNSRPLELAGPVDR